MTMIPRISPRVKVFGLSPEMAWADSRVLRVYEDRKYPCHITSANDRKHSVKSLHYSGNAIDYDLNSIPVNEHEPIKRDIVSSLTDEFDVVYGAKQDSSGKWHYHIHVEFQPKRPAEML